MYGCIFLKLMNNWSHYHEVEIKATADQNKFYRR